MCRTFLSQCLGPIAANVYIASSDVYTLGQFQAWQASLDVSLNGGVIWKLLSHALSVLHFIFQPEVCNCTVPEIRNCAGFVERGT